MKFPHNSRTDPPITLKSQKRGAAVLFSNFFLSMRRRQSQRLRKRLYQLQDMELSRGELRLKLGAAKPQSPSVWRLLEISVTAKVKRADSSS
jgi:hypothetical protein